MYVSQDRKRAIQFNYLVSNRYLQTASAVPIRMEGLDPDADYRIREINLFPGSRSRINGEKVYSGDFLMKVGINPGISQRRQSVVLEVQQVTPGR
jgi:alpha-galactosidase